MSADVGVPQHSGEGRPAGGVGWVLPFYDTLSAAAGIGRVHRELLRGAGVQPGHLVLDIGCGTGSLTLLAKKAESRATVEGLDPDEAALELAAGKANHQGLDVRFETGYGGSLPHAEASVDRVLSAFMLHHLSSDERDRTLGEVRRVLRPGGSVHVVDFGKPEHLAVLLRDAGFPSGTTYRGSVLGLVPVGIVRSPA